MTAVKVTTRVRLVGGYKPSWARGMWNDDDEVVDMLVPAGAYCEIWAQRDLDDGTTVYDLATVVGGDRIIVKGVVPEAFEVEGAMK